MVLNSRALLPSGGFSDCCRSGCPCKNLNDDSLSICRNSAIIRIPRADLEVMLSPSHKQAFHPVWDGETRTFERCSVVGRPFGNTHLSKSKLLRTRVSIECIGGTGLQSSFGEGPSCVFVGPVETAEKDRLEALYQQARDSYYNGQPLIVDDMFDKVEVRLRWYGSKLVLKYPRCSLKRLSAYADAEVDQSLVWALAGIWIILLVAGILAAAGPPACVLSMVCRDSVHAWYSPRSSPFTSDALMTVNGLIASAIGLSVGIPVATASVAALQGLWKGELVSLKGSCPSCGEEVYAFVRADDSVHPRHKTECHVCQHPLVFHAKVERSTSLFGWPWAYGRIYLVTRPKDLAPQ